MRWLLNFIVALVTTQVRHDSHSIGEVHAAIFMVGQVKDVSCRGFPLVYDEWGRCRDRGRRQARKERRGAVQNSRLKKFLS